ncbi:MAG: hypothetical protein NC231_11425 [Bacillus sp. (in: Bacteria)]|nr:hypothetical protein [Bacillus sp. (in: firmicutes)]MCM1426267.1 hypothetical protein [Eubacterium sp.]
MILSEVASCKVIISRTILNMEIPFKLSQLYGILEKQGITDRELILDVLNQLYEKGLVDYASVEDDTLEYESNFRRALQW